MYKRKIVLRVKTSALNDWVGPNIWTQQSIQSDVELRTDVFTKGIGKNFNNNYLAIFNEFIGLIQQRKNKAKILTKCSAIK